MWKILAFCLVGAASSSAAYQNAEYVARATSLIQRAVDEMPPSPRQMAINTLLKSVGGPGTAMTAEEVGFLGDIQTYLTDILNLLKDEATNRRSILQEVIQAVADCNALGDSLESMVSEAVNNKRIAHHDCREVEGPLVTTMITACDHMVDEMQDVASHATYCVFPPVTKGEMASWILHIPAGKAHFVAERQALTTESQACTDAMSAHSTKNTECNGLQETFEQNYCTWRSYRTTQCADIAECWDDEEAVHNNHTTVLMAEATSRLQMVAAIENVKCLIKMLQDEAALDDATVAATCPFPDVTGAAYQTDYGLTAVTIPPADTCNLDDLSIHPNDAAWRAAEYPAGHASFPAGEINTYYDPGTACN